MSQPGYLRHPAIHGESIAFVFDDDLWTVGAGGGTARRLTAGVGEPATPAFSRDGRHIAYVSRDEQHPEVYVMAAEGGPARRMTWLGPDVQVRGFTPDNRILFVTTQGQPFFRNYRAFTLALAGGLPEMLPWGQVNHLSYGPEGALVIGRNTADPARWKRYRGGTAGTLWVDAEGEGEFKRLTSLKGNISSPLWLGERVYFLSDAEGIGNLYSCRPNGSDVQRHTDHDTFYARHASTDGQRIVYQCAGDLWLFDPSTGAGRRLQIEVPSHGAQAARRFVPAAKFLTDARLHPKGHSLAFEVRGQTHTAALWEGAVRREGEGAGRQRFAQWLADGETMLWVGDGSGEERLEISRGGEVETNPADIGRVVAMSAAPKGSLVAIANHRNEIIIVDAATGSAVTVDRSDFGRSEELAWSPDGLWLAYPFWTSIRRRAIKLYGVADQTTVLATHPEFMDYAPAFDPDGRYLYFLSLRTFDPVYDAVQFELSFPRAARPYVIGLAHDAPSPFERSPRGFAEEPQSNGSSGTGTADGSGSGGASEAAGYAIRIDLEGLADRVAPFPVPEARYDQLAAGKGRVFWTVFPIPGAHGRGGHKDIHGRLEVFDFETQQTDTWADGIDRIQLSADASALALRLPERLRVVDARRKPEKLEGREAEAPSRKSGYIDLDRVRVSVDPRSEWRQMFNEVWRLQRDQFWVADMSGVDWAAIGQQYRPLLERICTRGELSDLIWELQGELGTSHAYEMGGDHRKPPGLALGQLAADLRPATGGVGYEIAHIARGDPWDLTSDSPLAGLGVYARRGDRIVEVNGQPVSHSRPPQALLVNLAGQKVELKLVQPDGSGRRVVVRALEDEVPVRYREWVERNRRWVHEHSKGTVGYLHVPDMQSAGFAEFHRYFAGECDRAGLIVDLRYNRGGHVSQLLLEKIGRQRIGYNVSRWGAPEPYPSEALAGAAVALTNEHAGSDGDIFSHCFKLMKLGPLVGTRTWGGVIGIWPRHRLVDGTETTQPEFSFWFTDVGWSVENYGTDPDIEIDNAPQDARAGRDRQLERALEVALERAAASAALKPAFGPRPVLTRPALPRRDGSKA